MAWIETVDEERATGVVKEHYDQLRSNFGFVPNIRKVQSLKPELMLGQHAFAGLVTRGGSSLGREREEMLAVVCSALLRCRY